jgi:hypothetical protein
MTEEQIKIAQRNAGDRDSGNAGGSAGSGGGYPAEGSVGQTGGSATSGGQGTSSAGGSTSGTSGGGGASGAPTPADVGNGSDDDIVARQLREAAESETDPALREKLWNEYRQYKQSLGN